MPNLRAEPGAGWHPALRCSLCQLAATPTLERNVWECLVTVGGFPSSLRRTGR